MIVKENWQLLTHTKASELNEAAVQLHHAAQFVAMFGNSLLPKAADDSQSNMFWLPEVKALAGHEVNLKRRIRMALLYETLELQLINENAEALGVFPLSGQTKTTAISFVRTQARHFGKKEEDIQPITHFSLPEHGLDKGNPFMMTDPAHFQELARYRHNAQLMLTEIAKGYEYASAVATWPHHFDTGSAITVKFDDQSNPTKTVGIGLAPADGMVGEFYFYVNHWQKEGKADYSTLPSLPAGAEWHTKDWQGAILKVSEVLKQKTVEEQVELVDSFLRSALEASFGILEKEAVKSFS
ncbi:MAG: hypothetical protein H6573_14820 [Lewinellaceae bacterium]|nr:hypothetical protein [Phaeodactylibacter sp.]MCB0615183.1 hypothetical protein [Phaeodactylibacter sp.]MCB9348758.1 hypothetical protein [Lewinellaceae bacterium]